MLGLEVIKAINCFLSIRATALAPPLALAPVEPGNSQDEFGMFDFDYEDPALNAMLGVGAAADDVLSENRIKDKALAEVSRSLRRENFVLISFRRLSRFVWLQLSSDSSRMCSSSMQARFVSVRLSPIELDTLRSWSNVGLGVSLS